MTSLCKLQIIVLLFITLIRVVQADQIMLHIGYLAASDDNDTSEQVLIQFEESLSRHNESQVWQNNNVAIISRFANKCDIGSAVQSMFSLAHKHLLSLVIHACTQVIDVIGELSKYWNIPVLALGSGSNVLKNKDKYPTLQLLEQVANTHNEARLAFIKHAGWQHVATFTQDQEDFTLAAEHLHKTLENASVTLVDMHTFIDTNIDIRQKVADLQAEDARITFIFGTARAIQNVLEVMDSVNFFDISCVIITNHQVQIVPDGVELFSISSTNSETSTRYGTIVDSLVEQMTIHIAGIDLSNITTHDYKSTYKQTLLTNFIYKSNVTSYIYQYQQGMTPVNYKLLAISSNGKIDFSQEIKWRGDKVPLDKKQDVEQLNVIEPKVLYVYTTLSVLGSIQSIIFLIINCKYKHISAIKMSSPVLNSVSTIGAVVLYTSLCIMGLDQNHMPKEIHKVTCQARNYLLSIGFSLVFGPMCAKAYRVHTIMASTKQARIAKKNLSDGCLMLFVSLLLIIDFAVNIGWQIFDPLTVKKLKTLQVDASDRDTDIYIVSHMCKSEFMTQWLGAIYASKGILLVLGVYLAWSTRHVTISNLNDSKSIMLNIYLVVAAAVLMVIVSIFLEEHSTLVYSVVGGLLFTSVTVMVNILFIPKMIVLARYKPPGLLGRRQESFVMRGTGLIASIANTRRLESHPTEGVKEMKLKMSVLLHEIEELDAEIRRLESLDKSGRINLNDMLNEEFLYIIPLPYVDDNITTNQKNPVQLLARKHTPKYKQQREKQRRRLQEIQQKGASGENGSKMAYGNEEQITTLLSFKE